jgi:predicted CXXCH cytochrome family protein
VEVQLRQQRQGPDGIAEYADAEISAAEITIGSAPDQQVQLLGRSVASRHAVIRLAGRTVELTTRGGARVRINGRASGSARLSPGDVIEIERHRISVTTPAPGFDLALTVEPDTAVKKSELEKAFRTELTQTWISKRQTAWALVILTPLLIFVIPLLATTMNRQDRPAPAWLIDDAFWTAGPLIPAHAEAAGRRCEACHKAFFVTVQDQECRKCHENVVDHVSPAHLAETRLGPPARCGECHEEHNAQNGSLVLRSDTFCVKCHARSEQLFGTVHLAAVSGFSDAEHPAFTATVLNPSVLRGADLANLSDSGAFVTPAGAETLVWKPQRVPVAGGLETSNLKFSHAQHLGGRVPPRRPGTKTLECVDCHVLGSDGAHFAPITMETTCAGGGCHDLAFDKQAPDRQLPHGKPRDAILLIQDYFAHKIVEPAPEEHGPPRRVLPDSTPTTQPCQGEVGVTRARCLAEREVVTQFTVQGCVTCHQVKDIPRAPLQERFTVRPVRLVSDYLPGVHFSHRTHAVQKNLTGQAACLSCHAAERSEETSHLMIPDKGKCLECHAEGVARDRVELECVSCHAYHADHSERPSQHT